MQWGNTTQRSAQRPEQRACGLPASLALAAVLLCGFADPVGHHSETPVGDTPVVAAPVVAPLTLSDAIFLDNDAVFGVRESLVVRYTVESDPAVAGRYGLSGSYLSASLNVRLVAA